MEQTVMVCASTKHLIQFSGGAGSWAAAKRVVQCHGIENVGLLFADTLIEDGDLYRFLIEGACNVFGLSVPPSLVMLAASLPEPHVDIEGRKAALNILRAQAADAIPSLHWIAEGRTPHEVFRDERMLGNSRFDPCSKLLKRRLIDGWKQEHYDPTQTVCYVGIDWSERHRFDALVAPSRNQGGWHYEAPLCNPPWMTKDDVLRWMREEGIVPPRLYGLGFSHNNCGGGCIKAGQAHWANLLRTLPERFAWWEAHEQEMRDYLSKDISMLTDRQGDGKKKPMTLRALRERVEAGGQIDMFDVGGCGCALPTA